MLLSMNDEFQINQSATLKGQLITSTAAAAGNTRVKDSAPGATVDTAVGARDWGAGEIVIPYLYVTAAADLNPGTSLKVDIVASTTKALTGSASILSTATYLTATLTAGTFHRMPALLSGVLRRYLGAIFTVAGADATTGAVICGLMHKNAKRQPYGDLTGSL